MNIFLFFILCNQPLLSKYWLNTAAVVLAVNEQKMAVVLIYNEI